MSTTVVATRLLPPDTLVRRARDGMIGRMGPQRAIAHTGWIDTHQEVQWLGEWTLGAWKPGPRSDRIEVLEDPGEREAAARRFAALECPACRGTGLRDPRLPAYDTNRCPEARCRIGRLLGVEPAFDASFAAYERWLEGRRAERVGPTAPAPGTTTRAGAAWRDATLRYAGTCVECGTRLPVGTAGRMRNLDGRWQVACREHAA